MCLILNYKLDKNWTNRRNTNKINEQKRQFKLKYVQKSSLQNKKKIEILPHFCIRTDSQNFQAS